MNPETLQKLIHDVFAPEKDEVIAAIVDIPHDEFIDSPDWTDRRTMAHEWLATCSAMGLKTLPLISYPATGTNNGELPETAHIAGSDGGGPYDGGGPINLKETLLKANIIIAMTTFSATAPLLALATAAKGKIRVASMPGVRHRMENTALAVDHQKLAKRVQTLCQYLEGATGAELIFSTGHKVHFDLRYRRAHADDGVCHRGKEFPLINLPSGEAFIAPYEGERPDEPSQTAGEIPVATREEVIVLKVQNNRIEEVVGKSIFAQSLRDCLDVDAARRNIAELGLGCNDRAVVSGVILEDEKAGPHWAYGRSEHLGGTIGPQHFKTAANILHKDIVYAKGSPVEVKLLTIIYDGNPSQVILRDGEYTVF